MTAREKTKFRTTKEWKAFRAKLILERNSTCEICGIRKKALNVHHKDEANYTDLREEKFSLVCRDCHQLVEKLLRRKTFSIDDFLIALKKTFLETKSFSMSPTNIIYEESAMTIVPRRHPIRPLI